MGGLMNRSGSDADSEVGIARRAMIRRWSLGRGESTCSCGAPEPAAEMNSVF